MKKSILLLLSLLSGILLWLSWPAAGLPFLIFFAFIPLFFLSDGLLQRGGKLAFWQGFIYSYPAFLIWNVATTWWIWNSTPPGSVAAFVLNAPDSLNLNDALRATVSNTLHQYDFVELPADDQGAEDDGAQLVYKYNTTTTVNVHYNQNDIITFCKTEVVRKNDKVTSVTHRYYSFDLLTMAYIDLHKLFREDAMADVTQLLRARLMAQNKATSDDQLNDIGYFNVDNLTVTRNFYFGDNGITWSYLPSQLAVDAIGEPQIALTYDQLAPLACDGSVIHRLH